MCTYLVALDLHIPEILDLYAAKEIVSVPKCSQSVYYRFFLLIINSIKKKNSQLWTVPDS